MCKELKPAKMAVKMCVGVAPEVKLGNKDINLRKLNHG